MENLLVTHHAHDRVPERGIFLRPRCMLPSRIRTMCDLPKCHRVDSPRVDRIGGTPVDLRQRGEEFSWQRRHSPAERSPWPRT
jgi:hypothetical protein